MMSGDVKLALHSIKTAKWRSFLTMLGIIIGVASVIVIVSIGEGVKKQVGTQFSQFGPDVITIKPGKTFTRDKSGALGLNIANNVGSSLTANDVDIVSKTDGVKASAPLSVISTVPRYEDREFNKGLVIGTTSNLPEIMNHKIQYGSFFSVGEEGRKVAVLGSTVAQELFGENVPVGKSFIMHSEEFIVRGVFEEFTNSPLSMETDYNKAVFIPFEIGKGLSNNNVQVFQIFAKVTDESKLNETVQTLTANLTAAHDKQENFTIFTQDLASDDTSYALTLITAMITGIAAISLLVGGIGIMNVMLVSVTERTHEIGVRKSIGATNRQIMRQFMTEAVILSFVGSLLGVILALSINFAVRIGTDLHPVFNWQIILIAVGVAVGVGIVFGIAPAYRAARKNPIDALRFQ